MSAKSSVGFVAIDINADEIAAAWRFPRDALGRVPESAIGTLPPIWSPPWRSSMELTPLRQPTCPEVRIRRTLPVP